MSSHPDWLPPILTLDSFEGNWDRYFEALYECFQRDFVHSRPVYQSSPLALKKHPMMDGKEATFWHIITEGDIETARTTDVDRCERICWPRQVIEHCDDPAVKVWENFRRGDKRTLLWLEDSEYVVILSERNGYTMLWTAYTVTRPHRKAQFQREYQAFVDPGKG